MSGPPPGGVPARSMSVGNGPPSAGLPPHNAMPPQPSSIPPPASSQSGTQSQQNLNQIVLEYLSKKGYVRTEAMLRKESEIQQPGADGRPVAQQPEAGLAKYTKAYELLRKYTEDNLELYRPELRKLLWPFFVYSFLGLLKDHYIKDAEAFFSTYKTSFEREHEDDVKTLGMVKLPQHLDSSRVAKLYLENRYRITLTTMPFYNFVQFLESKMFEGGQTIMDINRDHMNIVTVDRTATAEKSIAAILASGRGDDDLPAEDEGIPGHAPGHPSTKVAPDQDPHADAARIRLQLGAYPQEEELQEDVRAALKEEDEKNPRRDGQNNLVDEYDQLIKREPNEDAPSRDLIPLPPSLARDVSMEVQKVIEHRDRYKLEGRTGGIGPAVSVIMYTFHNTHDSVNCIDFSGDNQLVAAGMAESYIRVWSLEGKPLESTIPENTQPSSSRRLIGHAGPVYAVSFSPSTVNPDPNGPPTNSQYLLSASEDQTVRLWSLETWSCLVAYRGHSNPVWDLQWGPHGHYFLTGSNDRTARLWSTDHIDALRIYVGHDNDVDCIAFHPNNMYVFTGSCDRTVRMWHIAGGNCLRLFTGHAGNVTAIACSPDGKTLASADETGTIILWTLETGRRKKRMRGHGKGGIWSLSWSVESTVLVSAGADKTVRVWGALQETNESASKATDGAAGKADGALATKAAAGAGPGTGGKKAQKEAGVSADQISVFPTKDSPVYKVQFTRMNLVLAGGAYLPPPKV
ncbi:transcription initiation factor TFIID subunit 5 [Aaosphaeria arxii CBS 175.79]|uniref:Transcription initiation factor TFIID subunit 5 n=1 Tax=Aaosphaeria arxii CBS 175.79 TaxID=1450172 RepID=A0A6A5XZP5_9PLEO|nr:transcription initiation factor TFIID subunit 5 [Aaosphaeria arxii CBS 175.79]KAF2018426.1 transcription initiation factor TFIID subunit 5 [Aaosphaeria arxii CBS 175.79]